MKICIRTVAVAIFALSGFASCTHEDPTAGNQNGKTLQDIYERFDKLPRASVYSSQSATRGERSLPAITEADLQQLASLTAEQLMACRQSRLDALGAEKLARIEEKKAENMAKMYDLMGGHEGLDRLKAFMTGYMQGAKGWHRIEALMPQGLSDKQANAYLAMALYVDNIARPIYAYLTAAYAGNNITRGDIYTPILPIGLCEEYLSNALAGTGISIDDFLKAMDDTSEAAGPPANETWEEIDYEGIWAEYEFCRTHSYK